MKLSIITINYNNAEGLRKTLASVAAQNYAEIEHIIIDGGSTDGSVEIIREYADNEAIRQEKNGKADDTLPNRPIAQSPHRYEIRWLSEPDKGIYNAMNKGIEIALSKRVVNDDHTSSPNSLIASPNSLIASSPYRLSDYIQILNSGDILAAADVTERMVAALEQQIKGYRLKVKGNEKGKAETPASSPLASSLSPIENGPAIFYGNMTKVNAAGKVVGKSGYTEYSLRQFYSSTLNHDCAYIRRDLFEEYGLYDENLKIVSDWKWYLQAIGLGRV